jgi:hypothetical protein
MSAVEDDIRKTRWLYDNKNRQYLNLEFKEDFNMSEEKKTALEKQSKTDAQKFFEIVIANVKKKVSHSPEKN